MVAKTIAKKIGPVANKPVNIRTVSVEDLIPYRYIDILRAVTFAVF